MQTCRLRSLRRIGISRVIRVKYEIDKDAAIAALKDKKQSRLLADLGFSLSQKESFFIEPVVKTEGETEEVKI